MEKQVIIFVSSICNKRDDFFQIPAAYVYKISVE